MKSLRAFALLPLLAAAGLSLQHCGGTAAVDPAPASPPDGGDVDGGPKNPDADGAKTASKVDVLLVVDNSASMADKSDLLAGSIGTLVRKIVPVGDVHLGVISSSLGTMGGDLCAGPLGTEAQNQLAHFRNTARDGSVVAAAKDKGFLTFGAGGTTDVDAFVRDAETIVRGVGQAGCGFEAQLESAYRFLVQPDPWQRVTLDGANRAAYEGVDVDLLKQRAAFLRPDSLVVVVMLSDEDDSSADPRALGGQGWAFMSTKFPGSAVFRSDGVSTTAPRATSVCRANPMDEACASCASGALCDATDAKCQKIKSDPECQKNGGYFGPSEDQLNVRFHRMKERFGVDPQFPLSRYVDGFTKVNVPSRDGEHAVVDGVISPYLGTPDCTNPLFAASLPTGGTEERCALPRGPRGKDLVLFAVIGGVPETLVAGSTPDWTRILGASPDRYDFAGIDPHMIASTAPRNGVSPPSAVRGDNGDPGDPVGRDWDTQGEDLQYACTFDLPAARTCTADDPSCDCSGAKNPPLCGAAPGQQIKAKAYPSLRPLRVAKALDARGLVASICPRNVATGYAPTMTTLGERISTRLAK